MAQYVSELVTDEEIKKWKVNDNIVINAGTGSGKSYFVLNKLVQHTRKNNERILLLVPRNSIMKQFEKYLTLKDTHIEIKTYQWLEQRILKNAELFLQYDYIVCDEAHYFVNESAFNITTHLSFKELLQLKTKRLFLSATLGMLPMILKELNLTLVEYNLKQTTEHISEIRFFGKNNDTRKEYYLNALSQALHHNEKCLVFVNDLNEAKELLAHFPEDAVLYYNKNNHIKLKSESLLTLEQQEYMFESELLPKPIVITTSIMEMGVTLKDKQLKHIFTDGVNSDSIIQMIGRKRPYDDMDKLVVHIRSYSGRQIAGYRTQRKMNFEALHYLKETGYDAQLFLAKYPLKKMSNRKEIYGVYETVENGQLCYVMNEMYFILLQKEVAEYDCYLKDNSLGFEKGIATHFPNVPWEVHTATKNEQASLLRFLMRFVNLPIYEQETKDKIIKEIDYKVNGRLMRSPKQLNTALLSKNIPMQIMTKRDKRRYIISNDVQIENPFRNKTYWVIEYLQGDE